MSTGPPNSTTASPAAGRPAKSTPENPVMRSPRPSPLTSPALATFRGRRQRPHVHPEPPRAELTDVDGPQALPPEHDVSTEPDPLRRRRRPPARPRRNRGGHRRRRPRRGRPSAEALPGDRALDRDLHLARSRLRCGSEHHVHLAGRGVPDPPGAPIATSDSLSLVDVADPRDRPDRRPPTPTPSIRKPSEPGAARSTGVTACRLAVDDERRATWEPGSPLEKPKPGAPSTTSDGHRR